jgi:two-component system, NarL family, invasion response regulator UvrY
MGENMSRIYLVDDHTIVREGLRTVLAAHGHTTVGEAADAATAIEGIVQGEPDLVLLDIGLDGRSGLDVLARLQQRRLATRVVVLTMSNQPGHVNEALRLGAAAYVLKGSHTDTLLQAIAAVLRGGQFLDPALPRFDDQFSGVEVDADDRMARLSSREREVLLLVMDSHTSAAIGRRLHLSSKTVDTYRSRLMSKLGVEDIVGLVRFAIREGVIPVDSRPVV